MSAVMIWLKDADDVPAASVVLLVGEYRICQSPVYSVTYKGPAEVQN